VSPAFYDEESLKTGEGVHCTDVLSYNKTKSTARP